MSDLDFTLVLGLGKSGLSTLRFLTQQNKNVRITDNRQSPPELGNFLKEFPKIPYHLGNFSEIWLKEAKNIVISPGISIKEPLIQAAIRSGKEVIGDIECFIKHASKPTIAVTGSNGKSTIIAWMDFIFKTANINVAVGGNFGEPALNLLSNEKKIDYYLLELSSFQLETTPSFKSHTALLLNISEDHMDRYESLEEYLHAKQSIYQNSLNSVINLDQPTLWKNLNLNNMVSFSLKKSEADFYLKEEKAKLYFATDEKLLLPIDDIKLKGQHNIINALAILALSKALNLPLEPVLEGLKHFKGLPHRCQWIRNLNGINWYNDSKATNVGAAIAAIEGLGQSKKKRVLLIAGGQSKGANFLPLKEIASIYLKSAILMGEDCQKIADILPASLVKKANTLLEAVEIANHLSTSGDIVLLSPACASFDMFKDYQDRGKQFIKFVRVL